SWSPRCYSSPANGCGTWSEGSSRCPCWLPPPPRKGPISDPLQPSEAKRMSVLLSAASTAQSEPALLPMIVLGTIMVATYVVVAFEWMHKSIAAMVGAAAAVIAALAFGLFPVHDGERMAYTHV